MTLYLYRLLGAVTLDASMYEGLEADRAVTGQAALTVLLSSIAAGIGSTGRYGWHPGTFLAVSAIALVTWMAWASLMYQIGSRLLPAADTRTDLGELLRTTGFAAAPGMFQVFAAMPAATVPVFLLTAAWMFVAMVTAVKHALDYERTMRAIVVCFLGGSLCVLLAIGLGMLFSQPAS